MARPVEFDRDQALEAAMKLFWRQGYASTSLGDLLETMEIGRSSFYAAFGDKRSLFMESLALFSDRTRQILVDAWEETRSPEAIRRFFYDTLIHAPRGRARRGCMMVNTILELVEVDAELAAQAARELDRVEAVFRRCFADSQRAGLYPKERSPAVLAEHVMLLNQGLRVASRKNVTRSALEKQIEFALSLMGLSSSGLSA